MIVVNVKFVYIMIRVPIQTVQSAKIAKENRVLQSICPPPHYLEASSSFAPALMFAFQASR
jgi:hypothetical protein